MSLSWDKGWEVWGCGDCNKREMGETDAQVDGDLGWSKW